MGATKWYRVTLDNDRNVKVIEECTDAGVSTDIIVYVQAATRDGVMQHFARLDQKRRHKERRDTRRAQGLCGECGLTRDIPDKRMCSTCLAHKQKLRANTSKNLLNVPADINHRRLNALLDAREEWMACQNIRNFTLWLNGAIEKELDRLPPPPEIDAKTERNRIHDAQRARVLPKIRCL